MQIDLIGKKNIFLGFSGTLVILSVTALIVFGLKPGIDLRGGTEWQIAFGNAEQDRIIDAEMIRSALVGVNAAASSIKKSSEEIFIIRLPEITEAQHETYRTALEKLGSLEEKNFSSVGPTIGSELRTKAFWAGVLVLLGISLYIAWAFRKVSAPVKSWKYGVVTLLTLLHDVVIPAGMLAVLGKLNGIEIDTNFIVALLVIMGFSVHDTIVVFDRIRENLTVAHHSKNVSFGEIINYSVNETLTRSINTSFTLILVLVALIAFGPQSLFYFILTILVGTIFGTYSSIFVASPILYMWRKSVGK